MVKTMKLRQPYYLTTVNSGKYYNNYEYYYGYYPEYIGNFDHANNIMVISTYTDLS